MSIKYDSDLEGLRIMGIDPGVDVGFDGEVNTYADLPKKPEPKFKVGDAVRVIVWPERKIRTEWLERKPGLRDLFKMTAAIICEVDLTETIANGSFYQYALGFGIEHPDLSDCGKRFSPYSGIWMREDDLLPARLEDVLYESKQVFVIGSL